MEDIYEYENTRPYFDILVGIVNKYCGKPLDRIALDNINTELHDHEELNNWISRWCQSCPKCNELPKFSVYVSLQTSTNLRVIFGCDCCLEEIIYWPRDHEQFFRKWNNRAEAIRKDVCNVESGL